MERLRRLATQFALTAAISAVLSLTVPVFIDRNSYKTATDNFVKNPSPENEAIWRTEGAERQRILRTMRLESAGVLFVVLNASWLLLRKRHG
jgi:hypothetical protein